MERREFISGSLASASLLAGEKAQKSERPRVAGVDVTTPGEVTIERAQPGQPHRGKVLASIAPHSDDHSILSGGTIAKLFFSKAGGITIYQFDPGGRRAYYYAHLERYAPGLHDGQVVSQGDVIGYVGTSGNAPPTTPHLHFGVFELNEDRHWWQGRAIDPYEVFRR
jgi:hypothetical protein